MNNMIRYVMGLVMAVLLALPMQAQTEDDDVEVADSTMIDSLSTDSLHLPWPESVQVGIDKLLESKMFETSQVGIMIWDLQADSCIYKHNERQLMRPASTMKLLTAITALDKLGGSYQFKTQLKYTGTIENGVLHGDVYCVGGMDPRFNSDDMAAFVNNLREMGIDTIRGSVYADRCGMMTTQCSRRLCSNARTFSWTASWRNSVMLASSIPVSEHQ